jgi:HEAT repeats
MSEITQMALEKDRRAILAVRAQGPAAIPELLRLAENPEDEVREIALYGLDEVGDRRALPVFAKALLDPDPMIRGVAVRSLHKRPDPSVYAELLDAYDKSPEPFVRHNVALMLGRIGAPTVKPAELVKRFKAEADPFAQEGLIVALAKLGDDVAKERYVALLHASSGRERGRMLEHAGYIHDRWVLKPLLPILDDTAPVIRIGVDGIPGPEYLRACDVAVDLAAEISGWRFSFEVAPGTNYTPGDLAEVRRFLEGIPGEVS